VEVRFEDSANERGVLVVQRLLGAAQHFLQLPVVHFHDLQRVSHPAATGSKKTVYRSRPEIGLIRSRDAHGSKVAGIRQEEKAGQIGDATGRQSAAAPVRVGLPADSSTAS